MMVYHHDPECHAKDWVAVLKVKTLKTELFVPY